MSYDTPEGRGGGQPMPPPPGPYGTPEGQTTPPPGQYGTPEGQTTPPPGQYGTYGQPTPPPGQYGTYGQPMPPPPDQYGTYGSYGSYGTPPGGYGKPPPSYRAWAITCIVCGVLFSIIIGLPCALVALRYSRKVQPSWTAGDQQGAAKASRRAMIWVIVATAFEALGLIFVISLISHGGTTTT
jgi:Interferon-induced transmembrane protein